MSGATFPDPYPWPAGHRAAAVLSVDFDGPSPHLWSVRQGGRESLAELEQRRFGPRQGIWRVLAMLDRLQLRASFYVPGAIAAAHPAAVKAIVTAGHEVGLHGYLHERPDQLDAAGLRDSLDRSADSLVAAGASPPFGYRAPSWEMTETAWRIIRDAGVRYDSSLMGYDHPYWLAGMVEVPVQWTLDDAVFYRYTPASTRAPVPPSVVVDDWRNELGFAATGASLAMITIHPWLSGRAGRIGLLERMLADTGRDPDLWWTTAAQVADHHRGVADAAGGDTLRPGAV